MHMSTSNSKHGCYLYQKNTENTYRKGEHSCKYTELSLKRNKASALLELFSL